MVAAINQIESILLEIIPVFIIPVLIILVLIIPVLIIPGLIDSHPGARQVFERWMEWEPEEQAWHSYINFELRYKETDRARVIYERYILSVFLSICSWLNLICTRYVSFAIYSRSLSLRWKSISILCARVT